MDRDRLKRDVERIEAHRKEKADIAKSEREIFSKLKEDGFNCKVVREIIKRRAMEDSDGWDAEVALYEAAAKGLNAAADAVRGGSTYEAAAKEHGVRKADLHHYVQATGGVPDNEFQDHEITEAEARLDNAPSSGGGAGTPDEGRAGSVAADSFDTDAWDTMGEIPLGLRRARA